MRKKMVAKRGFMRTSDEVDASAIIPHRNANGHIKKDPKPVEPLAREQAEHRNRTRKPPQHTRKTG